MKKPATINGCLFQGLEPQETSAKMREAGFNLVRVAIFLKKESYKPVIDNYLDDGFSVQINLNWQPTTTPSAFPEPEDYPLMIERAFEFFEHYKHYREQIPLICFENEWDNLNYHTNDISYYLDALRIITAIAHLYRFKIADAGITSTAIKRWMYTQLPTADAAAWKQRHWIGENNANFETVIDMVEYYISRIAEIRTDYLNIHWYTEGISYNDFTAAAGTYMARCNKTKVITNEFGMLDTHDEAVWEETIKEVAAVNGQATTFAIAYSGEDIPDRAIRLTDTMLTWLADKPKTIWERIYDYIVKFIRGFIRRHLN